MKHYLIVVECAIEYEDKLLLIQRPEGKHAAGLLSFAGGKVDELDEAHNLDILRNAAKREIFEELGLILEKPLQYITSSFFVDSSGIAVIDNLFYYQFDFLPQVIASEIEVPMYAWMDREEINTASNSPEWLKRYIVLIDENKK